MTLKWIHIVFLINFEPLVVSINHSTLYSQLFDRDRDRIGISQFFSSGSGSVHSSCHSTVRDVFEMLVIGSHTYRGCVFFFT